VKRPVERARALAKRVGPWIPAWIEQRARAALRGSARSLVGSGEPRVVHLLVAICDHFEPLWTGDPERPGMAPFSTARERVAAWRTRYPELAERFVDHDGRPPRHSFFYPGEQYHPELLEPLAELCEQGLGEVEVHLHHDGDTRRALEAELSETLDRYADHGLVPTVSGERRFAFIHGNWCLANARKDGRFCGVDDELEALYALGCYADFTFPSAPDESQPSLVNAIYYPSGDVARRRAYEDGRPVVVGTPKQPRVLLVQGPLSLVTRPKGAKGLPIRIDAAALTATDPATPRRLRTWIAQGVSVRGRPDWVFLKLHTHGAPEREAASLLGAPQRAFHEELARLGATGRYRVHYVTARELYNVARAAMDGKSGDPGLFRNYEIPPPERARVECEAPSASARVLVP
jgi:hypothetical protein